MKKLFFISVACILMCISFSTDLFAYQNQNHRGNCSQTIQTCVRQICQYIDENENGICDRFETRQNQTPRYQNQTNSFHAHKRTGKRIGHCHS